MRWLILLLCLPALGIDLAPIEKTLREEMAAQRVPGAFLVVVERGQVILSKGYGVTSAEDPQPVTAKTLFRLGSTAKVFTALTALQLAEQGKLDLDAPIQFPGAFSSVTMHQLLTHTAGLADDAPQSGPLDEAALQRNAASFDAAYSLAAPGEVFSYANTGYVLAGAVIERASGQRFADAVASLVLRPLGMNRSTFRPLEAILNPLALPHGPDGRLLKPFPENAAAWPPGSLFTSAEEAARFLAAPLPKQLTARSVSILAQDRRYGYGVVVDGKRLFHTGGRAGYGSRFEFYPEDGVAFFAAGNRTGIIFSRTAEAFRAQLDPPSPAPGLAPQPVALPDAQSLVGTYRNGRSIACEFILQEEKLLLHLANRNLPVLSLGPDTYYIPGGAQLERFRIVRRATGQPRFLCAETWCLARQ